MSRRLLSSSSVWTLVGLAALGVIATVLSLERVMSDARVRDQQAVRLAAERVSSNLLGAISSLRGADVLASGGIVTEEEFSAYAEDIVPGSEFTALAFAEPVPGGERTVWEAANHASIMDSDGAGGFAPSPDRTTHVVVRFVAPQTETSARVRGLDFMGDPVRRRGVTEALDTDEPIIVGPSSSATSGSAGLFVIAAVRAADGTVVGFVAGGLSVDAVLSSGFGVGDVERLGFSIDDTPVVTTRASASAPFRLGGRLLTVEGQSSVGRNWLLPAVVASGTAVLLAGAWTTHRRQRRERERQVLRSLRNARLADLAEQLAAAPDATSVVATALTVAGGVIGADRTAVGRRDPVDSSKLIVASDDAPADDLALHHEIHGLQESTPLSACVLGGVAVVLPDRAAHDSSYPEFAAASTRSGIQAQICVPLSLGSEESVGAVAFCFREPVDGDRLEELVATAQAVAQLVGRALERARVREVVQNGIDLLGDLSRLLATARTRDDIAEAVADLVPPLLGVASARITIPAERRDVPGVRTYPLRLGGEVELEIVTSGRSAWNATYESLTRGIVDLVEGAWSRAELYDHGRSVLQQLQQTLLTAPPRIPGFTIAVAYRSAIEAVGIGGDWYSVIDDDGTLHAVIGDIAGHGPGAVALMAEVKTIVRYLLSSGSSIAEAADRASAALERRGAYASAVLVSLDRASGQLSYLNAGHPPPLIAVGSGVEVLGHVHRPWLGVAHPTVSPTVVRFPVGATALLYTDGLFEERGEHIDVSLARLRDDIGNGERPEALAQRLISQRATHRTARSVDDDIALIAIGRDAR